MSLDLASLRAANRARREHDRANRPQWTDWMLSQWSNATLGELGEAANIIKKIERGDYTLDEAREALAKEFADVLIYLDILADAAGIDLAAATIQKFDEVSDRYGVPVHLGYVRPLPAHGSGP